MVSRFVMPEHKPHSWIHRLAEGVETMYRRGIRQGVSRQLILVTFLLAAVTAAGLRTAVAALPGHCPAGSLYAPEGALLSPVMVNYPLTAPLSGPVTSQYGYRRHPLTGELDFHTGMDIAATAGTDIGAALPGTVVEVGSDPVYGNYVRMHHGLNIETRYCHCESVLVQQGDDLREGEPIARVGSTGMATGPHLHFEVYVDGLLADPAYLLEVRSLA